MPGFDRHAGGHDFDFDTEICVHCGITRTTFQDSGSPQCGGKTVRARWFFQPVSKSDVPPTASSQMPSNWPAMWSNEESDGYCGWDRCGTMLAKGLSATGVAAMFASTPNHFIICPKCLGYNRVPRP